MIGYFLKIKLKTFFYISSFVFFIIIVIYKFGLQESVYLPENASKNLPIILWWTPFINNEDVRHITCGKLKCILTENREYMTQTAAFLFYGSTFSQYDLPLPRNSSNIWALIHEESPKNVALFLHKDSHDLFNFTSTFSRYSNFPITLQHLPNMHLLTGTHYFLTIEEKNKLQKRLAPILYIQSDCVTPLERDSYVAELMKYIPVDSYGKCLNNKVLPEKLTINPLQNLYSFEFMHFVAQYKFVIACENAICHDYITEKLWRPLIAGSVPIYMGSPTVKDWLPNNNSVILADSFATPRDLASYISKVNTDDNLYNSYLRHKLLNKIENSLLRVTLQERKWSIDDDSGATHFFEAFECFVCENIHRGSTYHTDNNLSIYDCPEPISPLTRRRNESNWWLSHWKEGKCQAQVLKKFITDPAVKNYTKEVFDNETSRYMAQNKC